MTYAIVRKDLRESGELPPLKDGFFVDYPYSIWDKLDTDAIFDAMSPESIEDREYNYVLRHENNTLFYAIGIDFDFYETIEQARKALNG